MSKSLEESVRKLLDIHEIQNLMATNLYRFEAGKYEDQLALFAQKTPGVTVEFANWGIFEGLGGARKIIVDAWKDFEQGHGAGMKRQFPELNDIRAGLLDLCALASPVIEVAGDGQTAKGLWLAPGIQTEYGEGSGLPEAHWAWLKFAIDFVKEDGKWRFWHYHVCPCFRTPFHKSWVESSIEMEARMASGQMPPAPAQRIPDRPTSFIHAYSYRKGPAYEPKPPQPYQTFAETFSY